MAGQILVVDDDPLVLRTITKLLTRDGFAVLTAKDASMALECLKTTEINLLICDIRMPQTNGLELVRMLREEKEFSSFSHIPVIFITGYAQEDAPSLAGKLGARDYLLKPFDLDVLRESVKKALA